MPRNHGPRTSRSSLWLILLLLLVVGGAFFFASRDTEVAPTRVEKDVLNEALAQ